MPRLTVILLQTARYHFASHEEYRGSGHGHVFVCEVEQKRVEETRDRAGEERRRIRGIRTPMSGDALGLMVADDALLEGGPGSRSAVGFGI